MEGKLETSEFEFSRSLQSPAYYFILIVKIPQRMLSEYK